MPDENSKGYKVAGKSLERIGESVRWTEGVQAQAAKQLFDPNRRFPHRMEQVKLTEALKGTLDPDAPTYAAAVIQSSRRGSVLNPIIAPNVISVENRTCGCWPSGTVGIAEEISDGRWIWTANFQLKYQGEMLEDVPVAVNSLKDPSQGQFRVWRKNSAGDMSRTTLILDVVNRFRHISFDEGSYACAEYMDDEWRLYNLDCPGGASSSESQSV